MNKNKEIVDTFIKNVEIDKILDVLIEHGYLKGKTFLPKDLVPSGHGSCCYCGTCGKYHDDCVCNHNELLEAIYNIALTK